MNKSLEAAGYRPFTLPDRLPEPERGYVQQPGANFRLITADRKTLIWSQCLDDGTRAVLKLYRHRGAVDWQREKSSRFRVQREFDSLSFIDTRGVPCSKPLFWSFGYCAEFGRYEILATREIENIVPLDKYMQSNGPDVTKTSLLEVYGLVRLLHKSGCHHGAMYTRNILVAGHDHQGKPEAFIIDMPMAILFPYDVSGTKMAWIDLYILTADVIQHTGDEGCFELLKRYGLEETAVRKFMKHLKGYHPSNKLMRKLFRTECEMWKFMAHFGVRCYASPHLRG